MTQQEAIPHIGLFVLVRMYDRRTKQLLGAKLMDVSKKWATVKPFGHGHFEKVKLTDIRPWKSSPSQQKK